MTALLNWNVSSSSSILSEISKWYSKPWHPPPLTSIRKELWLCGLSAINVEIFFSADGVIENDIGIPSIDFFCSSIKSIFPDEKIQDIGGQRVYFLTADEIEANCTQERYDPMRSALPFDQVPDYEVVLGSEVILQEVVASPLLVAEGLKDVYDPEIPINIYDLGLVYDINISKEGDVSILLTLTSPSCPVAGDLPFWLAEAAVGLPGVRRVGVKLTFDPPWNPDMMNELARVATGIY